MRIIFYFFLLFLMSCIDFSEKQTLVRNIGETQGTFYNINYLSYNQNLQFQIDSILQEIDQSLSIYNSKSTISKLNTDKGVRTDTLFNEVFRRAQFIYEETDGYFDCTVLPLLDFWGFGPYKDRNIDSSKIENILSLVGFNKVSIKDDTLLKPKNMMLDFNGIAQGYSVDLICEFLENHKIKNYLVEIGGEVRTKGLNANGRIWRVGIEKPSEYLSNNLQVIISLKNQSLATSGNYRKFYEEDGVKYSHIIDPFIGFPTKNRLLSVSVLTKNCMDADAYATAFMAMGLEKTKKYLLKNPSLKVYLIYTDFKGEWNLFYSEEFEDIII